MGNHVATSPSRCHNEVIDLPSSHHHTVAQQNGGFTASNNMKPGKVADSVYFASSYAGSCSEF